MRSGAAEAGRRRYSSGYGAAGPGESGGRHGCMHQRTAGHVGATRGGPGGAGRSDHRIATSTYRTQRRRRSGTREPTAAGTKSERRVRPERTAAWPRAYSAGRKQRPAQAKPPAHGTKSGPPVRHGYGPSGPPPGHARVQRRTEAAPGAGETTSARHVRVTRGGVVHPDPPPRWCSAARPDRATRARRERRCRAVQTGPLGAPHPAARPRRCPVAQCREFSCAEALSRSMSRAVG
ncbi:hypothetical protein HMPREF1211_03225 [Streptomyces sp. HGB0020]|nr:hypothetical protein HMPREF1211_03225 [Streptomyces sp. HGB0020]